MTIYCLAFPRLGYDYLFEANDVPKERMGMRILLHVTLVGKMSASKSDLVKTFVSSMVVARKWPLHLEIICVNDDTFGERSGLSKVTHCANTTSTSCSLVEDCRLLPR